MDRRVLAVLLHEEVGGAVDVEVGGHLYRTRLTAASASEGFMSGCACWTALHESSATARRVSLPRLLAGNLPDYVSRNDDQPQQPGINDVFKHLSYANYEAATAQSLVQQLLLKPCAKR